MHMTYCRCGDSTRVDSNSAAAREYMLSVWSKAHSGDGHGECTREEAERARGSTSSG